MESDYDENELYQVENMGLEETKEELEWRKREFECKQKITYGIENKNDMTRIHDKEVKNKSECNLLHDIINPPKGNKHLIAINLLFYMYV